MKQETRDKADELIESMEQLGVEVTRFDLTEYVRGDPTADDAVVTGAEIEITSFLSFEAEAEEDNPYRVK